MEQLDLFNNPPPLQYSAEFPPQNCIRYVGVPAKKVDKSEGIICSCWYCNDWGDFS